MPDLDPDHVILGVAEAPEIFVDGYRGAISNGQIVKINFFTNRLEGGEPVKRAAFTLVTSLSDFVAMSVAFQEFLGMLQKDGVISIIASEGEKS